MAKSSEWFVYMLRCADNSFYTGITTDLKRRVMEHNAKKSVTKYTRVRQPVTMLYHECVSTRSEASQREAFIKKLSRKKKITLISDNTEGKNNETM